ncbi:hypothetical protein NL108_017359 [Boleophthalmus pectinirostris]|nr:hypothetical protein NL108_017359 [Boleophthalmus pectinirostris]
MCMYVPGFFLLLYKGYDIKRLYSRWTELMYFSLNARGLNSPPKRQSILDLLHRKNTHFAFIQETHYLEADTHRFQNKYFKVAAASCNSKKNRGVLIAIRRNLLYTNWAGR